MKKILVVEDEATIREFEEIVSVESVTTESTTIESTSGLCSTLELVHDAIIIVANKINNTFFIIINKLSYKF